MYLLEEGGSGDELAPFPTFPHKGGRGILKALTVSPERQWQVTSNEDTQLLRGEE